MSSSGGGVITRPYTYGDSTGKFAPIPASSPSFPAKSSSLGSCQRRPIRFSFHRRSIRGANQISRGEEIGGLAASRGPSSIFPPFIFFYLHSSVHTHTFTDTLTCGRTRKRVAPGDGGLAERRMLAASGPDPSPGSNGPLNPPNALKGRAKQSPSKHSGRSLDPCTCLPGRAEGGAAHVCTSPGIFSARTKAKAGKGSFFHSCFSPPNKLALRSLRRENAPMAATAGHGWRLRPGARREHAADRSASVSTIHPHLPSGGAQAQEVDSTPPRVVVHPPPPAQLAAIKPSDSRQR